MDQLSQCASLLGSFLAPALETLDGQKGCKRAKNKLKSDQTMKLKSSPVRWSAMPRITGHEERSA